MRIFGAHDGGSGCCYYRMTLPLEELGRHDGFDVTLASAGGERASITRRDLAGNDVIVGQRLNRHEGLQVWRGARTPTSRLVYEIDDDVFTVNAENWQAYSFYKREDIQDATIHGAQVADLITVTTEHLAEVMAKATGNQNVAVLPNHVPGWVLDMPKVRRDRPCIGWQGGASHGADVGLVADPVRRFLMSPKRFPGWDLRITGTDYRPTFASEGVDRDRMTYVNWVRVNDDPRGYFETMQGIDIALVPLTDNEFNRSKSALKALEFNALGIPVLASDTEPYRDYVKDGVNGFLIRQDHEWLSRMSELARDEALRERMSTQARECARIWTIENGWDLWAKAYGGLFK